ncbi:hypothetical protein [Streptomyces sp. NPDC058548]|uniref:hypothetical protein n=1 Tax=Streptomyces sp. NPDC058548 TaxID=3346545 RepID=UPI00365E446D
MSTGPGVLETILIALATTLVTTVGAGWLVVPRLEARKRRIGELHQARDRFLASMLRITAAAARLREMEEPAADAQGWTDVMRDRVMAERARWVTQLDETTAWMIDNLETYAVNWAMDDLRQMVGTYVFYARAVMISERTDGKKAERLRQLTEPVWAVFGSRGWQRGPRLLPRSQEQLAEAVAAVLADADPQSDAQLPVAS